MQIKALKSFQGRHGYIRAGQIVNLEDGYARDLAKNGLVEIPEGDDGPKPGNRQAMRRAPLLGARPGAAEKRPGQEAPLGDGPTLTPLSSRAAQARPKKTPPESARGGKKAAAKKTPARKDQPDEDAE
jgi:hypothetical protein